jgi:lipopolysaccharide transport system ATP-binding protein
MNPAVVVENLGKRYVRHHSDRPRTIMEAALAGFRKMRVAEEFWALDDVSFSVMPGQMLGVLGHNGAGKSTLLQVLSGIVTPDRGTVQVAGRMGALLDLGAGFHPDLTGRENVLINAIVGGLTKREALQRFDAIVEFAELADFIDNPLRTYSAGMQMRLGFSVAIHAKPDVMFIDEYLSVGDLSFQTKCLNRILDLKHEGCAIVLISHNAEQVQELCDQALWLEKGRAKAYGEPEVVASEYIGKMKGKTNLAQVRSTSEEAKITYVQLRNAAGDPMRWIACGDSLTIEIDYWVSQSDPGMIASVSISDADGQIYFNTNTSTINLAIPAAIGKNQISLELARLDLAGGEYFVNVGLYAKDWGFTYDHHWHQHNFTIGSTPQEQTRLYPPRQWKIGPFGGQSSPQSAERQSAEQQSIVT